MDSFQAPSTREFVQNLAVNWANQGHAAWYNLIWQIPTLVQSMQVVHLHRRSPDLNHGRMCPRSKSLEISARLRMSCPMESPAKSPDKATWKG